MSLKRIFAVFLVIALIMAFNGTRAQARLGLVSSNYAGSQGIMINPSSILNSRLYMDIHLLSLHVSGQNNYLYIPAKDYSVGHMFRQFKKYTDDNAEEADMLEQSYNKGDNVNGHISADIYGPSFMFALQDQAFGFYSGLRSYVSGRNLPFEQLNFAYVDLNLLNQLSENYIDENYWLTAASWLELGFTYARVLKRDYNRHWSGGVTIKRLLSYAGSFTDFKKIDYRMEADGHAFVNDADFDFGYALPVDYSTNSFNDNLKPLGKGWGIDLGVTYKLMDRGYELHKNKKVCEQEFEEYYFKLGVSIVDIGTIHYKTNARLHHYYGSMEWPDIHEYDPPSVTALSQEISTRFFGDPAASLVDTTFKIGLPTSLNVQTDYHYRDRIYFGSMLMLPLKMAKYQLRRPALLAFIPRYETPHFEMSLPLSFYDFYEMRLGFSVRYGFLTLGTDKLGSFLGMSHFDGFDFYMTIKFNFRKGKCADKFLDVCRSSNTIN